MITNSLGYVAAALVLAAFSVKSMRALRCIAIASNFAFIAYAIGADLVPVLVLHVVLLPINVARLAQLLWPGKATALHEGLAAIGGRCGWNRHGVRLMRASPAGR